MDGRSRNDEEAGAGLQEPTGRLCFCLKTQRPCASAVDQGCFPLFAPDGNTKTPLCPGLTLSLAVPGR